MLLHGDDFLVSLLDLVTDWKSCHSHQLYTLSLSYGNPGQKTSENLSYVRSNHSYMSPKTAIPELVEDFAVTHSDQP